MENALPELSKEEMAKKKLLLKKQLAMSKLKTILSDIIQEKYYKPFMRALPTLKMDMQIEKANKEMNLKIKKHAESVKH